MISYYPQKNAGCQEGLLLKEKETKLKKKTKYSTVSGKGKIKKCHNCLQEGNNARTCKNEKIVPPPKEKKPPGRPKKPHSDETPSKRPITSGGRGGRGPTRAKGGRGSSAGTSSGGGSSLIDEMFDSPMENEVINMFDNFEEELYRVEMERGETNWEDQSHVVGRIAIDVPIIREKLKPRKPSG
ncbi:unnamed protein product [Lactuca saligna]|uniref:Uncharacterized protein n=1 Tax=Lactuca saligna TaxID=75948 RepID=A0AA35Z0X6_LACSI|nr:unnamed protein product [Lactuca saligna]